jgi:hypothetical protein
MVTPMAVLRHLTRDNALKFLHELPYAATIYSHPMFEGAVFDPALARDARTADALPFGGKVAKLNTDQVRALHAAAGDAFRLWDGSSRRIAASLSAGAAGIVATPLSSFSDNFPAKDIAAIQLAVDPVQSALDAMPTRADRTDALIRKAVSGD